MNPVVNFYDLRALYLYLWDVKQGRISKAIGSNLLELFLTYISSALWIDVVLYIIL